MCDGWRNRIEAKPAVASELLVPADGLRVSGVLDLDPAAQRRIGAVAAPLVLGDDALEVLAAGGAEQFGAAGRRCGRRRGSGRRCGRAFGAPPCDLPGTGRGDRGSRPSRNRDSDTATQWPTKLIRGLLPRRYFRTAASLARCCRSLSFRSSWICKIDDPGRDLPGAGTLAVIALALVAQVLDAGRAGADR